MSEAAEKPDGKVPERKQRSRVLRYDQVYDLRSNQSRLIKSTKPEVKSHKSRKPVLIVRRIIDYKGRHTDTKIDIPSKRVAAVLTEINDDVEGLSLRKNPPVADPHIFFHNRDALRQRLDQAQAAEPVDEALVADLQVTVDFVDEEHSSVLANVGSLFAAGETTWELLWALFPPNCIVYHYHELTEQHQLLRFRHMRTRRRDNGGLYWAVSCDIVADDGVSFGVAKEPLDLEMDEFEGARQIQALSVYPLTVRPDAADLRAAALARGCAYAAITAPCTFQTSGPAMFEKRDDFYRPHWFKFSTHGRAIVDAAAFRSFNPNLEFLPAVHRRLDRARLTDEQLLICSPVALGFSFGDKKWGGLAMSRLLPVVWNSQAFQTLVLDPKPKMLIHALVKQHASSDGTSDNDDFDDIISGKGKGLIGLLSGPPGCGKTLTAEAVAEVTRRPLYTVSAGELGVEPKEVDERLTLILELAHRWDAVLLLDEADVFLQARNTVDVNRNALVSIFLRQLEYFQGILILTTNRLAQCDPAFDSRIHIAIPYPDLDAAARRQVWSTFLHRARGTPARPTEVLVSPDQIDALAERPVNGRQIKNIVSGARTIAKELGQPLSIEHIEMVLDVVGARNKAV